MNKFYNMPVNQKRRSQKRRSQKRRVGGGLWDWFSGTSTDVKQTPTTGTPTTGTPTAGTPTAGTPTTGTTLTGGKSRKMRRQRR